MKQKTFNYKIPAKNQIEDFYVSQSNYDAYNFVLNAKDHAHYSIIFGPKKSGKTHLGLIWKFQNNAVILESNNFNKIIKSKNNIFIDDFMLNIDEENLFHIINHCYNNNLKILLTTSISLSNYKFNLKDLSSRLRTFNFISIKDPDDELILNLIIKLLFDKQIIINNPDIAKYISSRINRSYESINLFIKKIDKLSLEKKRQLTIPLIKELL